MYTALIREVEQTYAAREDVRDSRWSGGLHDQAEHQRQASISASIAFADILLEHTHYNSRVISLSVFANPVLLL